MDTNLQRIAQNASQLFCHGIEMVDVTGELRSRRVDDSYVDDSDTYATAPETETVEEAVDNLTNSQSLGSS
jgi:hypothetical protein